MALEAVGVTVGGALLSASLQVLFDRMASRQFLDFFREQEFDHDLWQKLKLKLLALNSVLTDAEEQHRIMNLSTKEWLAQLKDAIYDAENLLDEIATEALRYNREAAYQTPKNQVRALNNRLEQIFSKVELIAKEKDSLGLKEGLINKKSMPRLPTTSLVNKSEECFRKDEKEQIVSYLQSDNSITGSGIPVIAIVGISGIGKTTLAQFLYNDERVKTHFELRAWAYVSERSDVFKVKLGSVLMGKKFLLVLDDMWNESSIDWDLLQRPFQAGARGSKIIVTMRGESVSSPMHSFIIRPLTPLSNEDCFSLFAKHAFESEHQIDEDSTLKSIGEKIVEKCKGLPLAAKTLGGLLHSKLEAEEWDKVLNGNIWDLPSGMNDILPALRLSYYHLPSHLKRCFAYCSLFPKGYEIEKGNLIRLWIAEGLVLQGTGTRRMEEVGEQYFNELLSRSFFQQSTYDGTCFKMHDLVNDLAQHIAGDFYFRYEDGCLPLNPERVRHLSFVPNQNEATEKFFEAFYDLSNRLRAFLPLKLSPHSARVALSATVLSNLFPESSCLRVLSLSPYHILTLDDWIGNLKHLRYLDLSRTEIERLPKRVCSLYNLETLKLSGCQRLTQLPTDIPVLTKLEHLDIKGASVKEMPPKFGNLKSLQSLSTFVVSRYWGSRISELKKLSLLCGTLTILGLQKVSQTEEASEASLKDKKYLRELIFQWAPGTRVTDTEVLDKLRPHQYLKKLQIRHFGGKKLPDWIGDSFFSQMVSLHLFDCGNCSLLPPLGQLPRLKELYISKMKQIEHVGSAFCGSNVEPFKSLEILKFEEMPNWRNWLDFTEGGFPSLQELTIHNCPKLMGNLPNHLPSLVKLHIIKCRELTFLDPNRTNQMCSTLERLHIMSSCDDLKLFPLDRFPNLVKLKLQDCGSLSSIRIRQEHEHLTCLQKLKIKSCPGLGTFSGRELSSLQKLKISHCANLFHFGEGDLPTNLQVFCFKKCPMLQNEWRLQDMRSLRLFKVDGVVRIPSRPLGGGPRRRFESTSRSILNNQITGGNWLIDEGVTSGGN
ncbi:putative disease resistance RPP13-like protein 1 isoform X2 [Durio zibethinus]|uniref:Disease resistance RPP13-like protein 1 isoform X2 n=1 Tax=Durio zibethinus TaxID=66656 RepID=A0A6P6AHW7_DURZI|nr:putative disease resistance RPP13-like protein 1 isoform X2 [Durio zibethinus]